MVSAEAARGCGAGLVRVWSCGLGTTRGLPGGKPLPAPGVASGMVLQPSAGDHLGGGPSGSGELAEVVAGEVEDPLDLGFDLAAQP
jgi:hypothetical protein